MNAYGRRRAWRRCSRWRRPARPHRVSGRSRWARLSSGPGTLTEARKFLQGRWALESFEVHPPGKAPIALKGSGVLNYDEFGNMRMEIRADEAESDLLRAAGITIRDGVISTDGRTVIDLPEPHPHLLRRRTAFFDGHWRRAARHEPAAALGGHRRRAHADDP